MSNLRQQPTLKPLYVSLKRLRIGEYLSTEEHKLYLLEYKYDELALVKSLVEKSHLNS